jgi:predicted 2-oxoglutarate/Fe(II)-dependent dioxygenase YbiX
MFLLLSAPATPVCAVLTPHVTQTELAELRSQLEAAQGAAGKAAKKAAEDMDKLKQQLHNQMKANQKNSETAARVSMQEQLFLQGVAVGLQDSHECTSSTCC